MINLLAQVDLAHSVSSAVADGNIDINQIAQLSNGNPLVMLALGAVGILGGKKVWDWLKQKQEQQHEEKMAELKLSSATGHEQCVAKQEELGSQVSALKAKLNEINHKAVETEKASKEIVEKQKQEVSVLEEGVKKLKKKVKKIQEEIEEQEERERKSKKKKVRGEDDE
jgi:hypothetical protein